MKFGGFCLVFVFILSLSFASSAHYISGYVDSALDSESSNNKIITLWNSANGVSDNLTDVIGVNGASNSPNTYLIDCELLDTPCQLGDVLNLKIYDNSDGYLTSTQSVTVTAENTDYVAEMKLNSPPATTINSPSDLAFINSSNVEIDCSYSDLDSQSGELSLYGNFSGLWAKKDAFPISSGDHTFSLSLAEGVYSYACSADDSLVETFSENRTMTIDLTSPSVETVLINKSSICGNEAARVACKASDANGVSKVLIQENSPSGKVNYTAISQGGDNFYYDFSFVESGTFNFQCFSFDSANNIGVGISSDLLVYSGKPELSIVAEDISFDKESPIEGESVTVSAIVKNKGCVDSSTFDVKFYAGSVAENNLISPVKSISLAAFSSFEISTSFLSSIGNSNYFVSVDSSNLIQESEESNNLANKILAVPSWQEFYGNVEAVRRLDSGDSVFEAWESSSLINGNIFIVDSEGDIDWTSLFPVGRNSLNVKTSNDFSEIDSFLGMSSYIDSVSTVFESSSFDDFFIHGKNVGDVPIVKSTNNDNFYTGILWDATDDTDGEYGGNDKEDLVFVTEINRDSVGEYGTYDYELKIPAKLREYDSTDSNYVYFYYDLI